MDDAAQDVWEQAVADAERTYKMFLALVEVGRFPYEHSDGACCPKCGKELNGPQCLCERGCIDGRL